ncbi:unnamed protein product [Penicillium manginii]
MCEDHLDVLKESQWEIYRKFPIPEHILVPSTEVENKNFSTFPWLSSCYQRGAVRYASSSKYELTGIAPVARLGGQPYQLPRDKNIARISGVEEIPEYDDKTFTHFRPAGWWMHPNLHKDKNMGYVFHYYCWNILGHLAGKELIEKELDKVVEAARKYWQIHHQGYKYADVDTLNRAQIEEVSYLRCEEYPFGCDIYVNPWIIPELQDKIRLAKNMVETRKSSYLNRLPLEISLLVAEIICPVIYTQSDVQNLRNMLSLFVLNLPDTFWRSRLQSNRDLFFEVDLLETDSVDWQLLWLELMGLLSDKWYSSSGLAHREKLLGPIKGIIANLQ